MKKIWVKSTMKLIGTFIIACSTLFGYTNVESKIIDKDLIKEYTTVVETKKEKVEEKLENKIEEIKEESTTEEETTSQSTVEEYIPQPVIEEVVTPQVVEEQKITENKIIIPNTLDKYLMKDETGEHFYLNHNIYGNYDGIGVPYVDFRTDFQGRKTIIYAHSSTTGNGPFQVLQNYHNNKWFYDNNRFIIIQYNGIKYTYEIFSIYISTADSEESEGLEYFHQMNYTDLEWEQTLLKYKNNSEYDTGVEVNSTDKILILQTCSMDPNYYAKYYRYNQLVMGKLISVE